MNPTPFALLAADGIVVRRAAAIPAHVQAHWQRSAARLRHSLLANYRINASAIADGMLARLGRRH
jgi:hypothetical protein